MSSATSDGPDVASVADELNRLVWQTAVRLRALDEASAAVKVRPEAWSVKEIVGHLVDSAANNLHRFVRAQQTPELSFPDYEQDWWVRAQGYQERRWPELLELWVLLNVHVSHAIRRIDPRALAVPCRIGGNDTVTLQFLVEDYLVHLRHHLKQIEERRAS